MNRCVLFSSLFDLFILFIVHSVHSSCCRLGYVLTLHHGHFIYFTLSLLQIFIFNLFV